MIRRRSALRRRRVGDSKVPRGPGRWRKWSQCQQAKADADRPGVYEQRHGGHHLGPREPVRDHLGQQYIDDGTADAGDDPADGGQGIGLGQPHEQSAKRHQRQA